MTEPLLAEPSGLAPRRAVLLGASNLMRGISVAVETARLAWGRPLDVLAATGSGRSYGRESWWTVRALPGILDCGLWRALAERPRLPTAALVTDIGNDIPYGRSAETIAQWVGECLERLTPYTEQIVVTELPLGNLEKLDERAFRFFRSMFFPRSDVTFAEALQTARELNERVIALAAKHKAVLVRPEPAWYGVDPIHIHRVARPLAWQTMLASWTHEPCAASASASFLRWLSLRSARPLDRKVWRWRQQRTQPAVRLRDGSQVSFF